MPAWLRRQMTLPLATNAKPFQVDDLERLFCFCINQTRYRYVKDLEASRGGHSRDSIRNQKQRDKLVTQIQQVTETVAKNAWLTGPENMGARERGCGVRWAQIAFYPELCWRYNPQI